MGTKEKRNYEQTNDNIHNSDNNINKKTINERKKDEY